MIMIRPLELPVAFRPRILLFSSLLILLVGCFACDRGSSGATDRVRLEVGNRTLQVRLLRTNEQRLKGVVRFPRISDGEGVLFVYPEEMPDLYWSNRTILDQELSVAFIGSDHKIIRVKQMSPGTGQVVNGGRPAQFLLVTSGGWFRRKNISAGDRIGGSRQWFRAAEPVRSVPEVREVRVANVPVRVEVAASPPQRRTGLMHRKALPKNHGMIFLYASDGKRSFHMKNTLIPLDIAFLSADGTIMAIRQMDPLRNLSTTSSKPVRHVLELRQNWFRDHGVSPGDVVDLSAIETLVSRTESNED